MTEQPSAVDRARWLARTGTRWILALGLLFVAALVGGAWTLGLFSSSSPNPGNVVTAGSMTQANSADDQAIMRVSGMVPGTLAEGSATIENVGDARGDFVVRVIDVTDEPGPGGGALSEALRLRLYEGDRAAPLWTGPLTDFDVDLGVWEPGEERTYRFEVLLPSRGATIDNRLQRSRATATYEWFATQAP